MTAVRSHDLPTVIAVSAIAFIVADLSHEAFGHGLAAFLEGAHQIVLSYTYLSSDLESRLISLAGPVVNGGLLVMPSIVKDDGLSVTIVGRSIGWIIAGLVAAAGFVFVIGPGINLR